MNESVPKTARVLDTTQSTVKNYNVELILVDLRPASAVSVMNGHCAAGEFYVHTDIM